MLKSTLRRIATHFAPFLRLCLCIKGRNTRTLDVEEQALGRALTNLHHLEIEC
jgi:hypothetical protein